MGFRSADVVDVLRSVTNEGSAKRLHGGWMVAKSCLLVTRVADVCSCMLIFG